MEKRFILAIFLMVLILVVFQRLGSPPPQEKGTSKETPEENKERIEKLLSEAVYEPSISVGVPIDSPLYTLLISENGGIRSYILKEYKARDAGSASNRTTIKKSRATISSTGKISGHRPSFISSLFNKEVKIPSFPS